MKLCLDETKRNETPILGPLCYTSEEFDCMIEEGNRFIKDAVREGVLV